MKKIIRCLGALGFCLLNIQLAIAAENNGQSAWQDIKPSTPAAHAIQNKQGNSPATVKTRLKKFRSLSLNESLLKRQLSASGIALSRSNNALDVSPITIPLPGGEFIRVSLEKTQLMAPELAAKYPEIKTWKITGADKKGISGRVDFTHYGFHAMLTMADGDTVFVERDTLNSAGIYNSFSRRENEESFKRRFQCKLHGEQASLVTDNVFAAKDAIKKTAARQASPLILYRLAVATTAEYTQFHGSVNTALSAIVTTINRVNEINERDLGITFQLIPEEGDLIYTNAATDPYTNGDSEALLGENMLNLNDNLGSSKFDIGHVFSQGNPAGLALFQSACKSLSKAGGVTGFPTPEGDAFDLDFVAHELGHQLGGTHTFNSETLSCGGGNRTAAAAVEPGSGSTIMAYAGICGENNLQNHSDAVYHAVSIGQIFGYTRNDTGSSCGLRTAATNQDPEPDAGQDVSIPANTPFILSGSGSDPDLDQLTYSWEQIDAGTASDVNIDTGDNAIIRSFAPVSSNQRFIPRLIDLFTDRRLRGELLPETSRELNFSLTVRDNRGGFDSDTMKLQVVDTGRAFTVTSHTTSQSLSANQSTTISWDVAGTSAAPINCNTVDISLLAVNGEDNFITQTANDGLQSVTIPANISSMSSARIMLKCSNNAFFNVSSADLSIQGTADGVPPVISLLGASPANVLQGSTYTDPGAEAEDGFDANVSITTTGSVNTSRLGTYILTYTATDDSGNSSSISRIVNVVERPTFNAFDDSSSGGGGSSGWLFLSFVLLGLLRKLRGNQL